ncbi:MAG: hypothetical protein ACRDRP_12800 [Pseudonocardiaceae bacterium]
MVVAVEVQTLRAGVDSAVARAVALAGAAGPEGITVNGPGHRFPGHRLQTIPGDPDTSIHWESDTSHPTVRNLRPVTHLDPRLDAGRPHLDERQRYQARH